MFAMRRGRLLAGLKASPDTKQKLILVVNRKPYRESDGINFFDERKGMLM
jgi:hypothetical protein